MLIYRLRMLTEFADVFCKGKCRVILIVIVIEVYVKILFVTYSRAMLGANRSMLNLILDLRERYGVCCEVLASDVNDGNLTEELEKEQIAYYCMPMKHWVVPTKQSLRYLRGLSTWIKNGWNIRNIQKSLQLESYDLIYSNNSTVQTGAYLAYSAKKPHIWHVREFGNLDYNIAFNFLPRYVNRWFRRASQIITVSHSLEEYIAASYAKNARIATVYNGVVKEMPARKIWHDKDSIEFCYVGALQEGKNQIELLKAANGLLQAGYERFHINFVGNGTSYKEKLEKYVSEHQLEKYVTFWGYQKDVGQILKNMDVGIICSRAEAFGRVTCEYMEYSMPVIGANVAGTAEIIEEQKTGYLYNLGEIEDLSNKMILFMEQQSLIASMGTCAYEKVCRDYTVKSNTDSVYQIIKRVINE